MSDLTDAQYTAAKLRAWDLHKQRGHDPMDLNAGEQCFLDAVKEIERKAERADNGEMDRPGW